MKEIEPLKKSIKTFSLFFTFIVLLYPIKGLFAYMEEDVSYLGLVTTSSEANFTWFIFIIKFISNIVFFIGLYHLIKTLNIENIKDLFIPQKIELFKKTGQYFLRSAGIGSLVIIVEIFSGDFASLKSNNDFLFTLYFSLIVGFFFFIFSKVLQEAKEIKSENDLTI